MLANAENPSQVQAQVFAAINELDEWLSGQAGRRLGSDWAAHYALAQKEISSLMENPAAVTPAQVAEPAEHTILTGIQPVLLGRQARELLRDRDGQVNVAT